MVCAVSCAKAIIAEARPDPRTSLHGYVIACMIESIAVGVCFASRHLGEWLLQGSVSLETSHAPNLIPVLFRSLHCLQVSTSEPLKHELAPLASGKEFTQVWQSHV